MVGSIITNTDAGLALDIMVARGKVSISDLE